MITPVAITQLCVQRDGRDATYRAGCLQRQPACRRVACSYSTRVNFTMSCSTVHWYHFL